MSNIVKEDVGNLNSIISITIGEEDYGPKLKSELIKYRQKANIKGFRKGKTPIGLVKKMYGKAIMAEVINESLTQALNDYIAQEKLSILGQPIPIELDTPIEFDIKDLKEFNFKYEIGLSPDFEVQGIFEGQAFDRYEIEFPESMVEENLEHVRKNHGENEPVDTLILENDLVEFDAEELDGENLKENGWATTFSILISPRVNDEVKTELLTKKQGDKIRFNINEIEKDASREHVEKYLLNVTPEETQEIGDHFEAVIKTVKRRSLAELNQEFFDKAFGEGKVNSEAEAKAFLKEQIENYYVPAVDSVLFKDVKDKLIEENNFEVPESFLKKWIKLTNKGVTDEQVEKEFPTFVESLRWSLITGKLNKRFELEVTEDEIFESIKGQIRGYFQGFGDELVILNMANKMMEDKNQVEQIYQEVLAKKLFSAIKDVVKVNPKSIALDDFNKMVDELNNPDQPAEVPVNTSSETDANAIEEEVVEEGEI